MFWKASDWLVLLLGTFSINAWKRAMAVPGPKVIVVSKLSKPVLVLEVVLLIRISIGLDHRQSEILHHLHLPRLFAYISCFVANTSLYFYQPIFEKITCLRWYHQTHLNKVTEGFSFLRYLYNWLIRSKSSQKLIFNVSNSVTMSDQEAEGILTILWKRRSIFSNWSPPMVLE